MMRSFRWWLGQKLFHLSYKVMPSAERAVMITLIRHGTRLMGKALASAPQSEDFFSDADARLKNAAADLLEALKAAKEVVDVAEGMTSCQTDDEFVWSAQRMINAAIAKAEGRSI